MAARCDGFELLRPGLKRAYARARKDLPPGAATSPSDEALHEWRKRSKDLWYQLRLVRRGWPELMGTTADEAHELSDRLGDDHDLVVLTADLDESDAPLTSDQLEQLRRLIAKRREELQERPSPMASGCSPRSQNVSSIGSRATGGH